MDTMKRAVITGIKQMELIDERRPQPIEDWVLVKIMAIPLCTEYKAWLEGHVYPGHEAAGEVVAIARTGQSSRVRPGDRVAVMPGRPCGQCSLCVAGDYIHCQHGYDDQAFAGLAASGDTHVQYLLKQDWLLAPIPDGVSFERGALACCALGPTFGALRKMNASAFDIVLISGAGPVGLGGIVNAKYRGCRVISVDAMPYRLDMARDLGADLVLDVTKQDVVQEVMDFTSGRGADLALETSGTNPGALNCLEALKRLGTMAFIGENGEVPIQVSSHFIRKGITVFGQWHYNRNDLPAIMQVIKNSPVAAKLITHRFPMTRINEALEVSATHACGKIMIDPWQ